MTLIVHSLQHFAIFFFLLGQLREGSPIVFFFLEFLLDRLELAELRLDGFPVLGELGLEVFLCVEDGVAFIVTVRLELLFSVLSLSEAMPQFLNFFNQATVLIDKTVELVQHVRVLGLRFMPEATASTCLGLKLLLFQLQNLEFKLAFVFFEFSDLSLLSLYQFGHLVDAAVLEAAPLLHCLQSVEGLALIGLRPRPFFLRLAVLGAKIMDLVIFVLQGQLAFVEIHLQLLRVFCQFCDLIRLLLLLRLCLLQLLADLFERVLQFRFVRLQNVDLELVVLALDLCLVKPLSDLLVLLFEHANQ